jgi:copper resistance protein C
VIRPHLVAAGNRTVRALRRPAAALLTAAVVAVAVLGPATPASAHSRLERTDPADGGTVTRPMSAITLTFNERVHGDFTTVVVTGPGSRSYSHGHVRVIDDNVYQDVYPLHSGSYTVAWRAISADGHPVDGRFAFTVTLPAGDEPSAYPPVAGPATPATHGSGSWPWIAAAAGGVIVVALGAVLVLRGRRRPVIADD